MGVDFFYTVDLMGIDILEIDIMGVDTRHSGTVGIMGLDTISLEVDILGVAL